MIEKYQTIPVTEEAVQWNGQNFDEIKEFTHGNAYYHDSEGLFIRALEGQLHKLPSVTSLLNGYQASSMLARLTFLRRHIEG